MDKVLCPWCGEEIEIRVCDAEGNIPLDQDAYKKDPWSNLFYCLYHPEKMDHPCPIATFKDEPLGNSLYDSEEEAYAAAMRRPLQKPLTLEETKIQIAVWVERMPRWEGERVAVRPETYAMEYRDEPNYGKTWRCWATKPSEEERSAAKWE